MDLAHALSRALSGLMLLPIVQFIQRRRGLKSEGKKLHVFDGQLQISHN